MRNRYEGICYKCGCHVPVGYGYFERHLGHWRVQCVKCCNGRKVRETDREVIRAKRLRAEADKTASPAGAERSNKECI